MRRSVAMATYNGGAYIREQLDSVRAQLDPDDEIIVSDDGSTDDTRAIVEALSANDPRIRLTDGPQQGLIRNFEHALSLCRGEIIFLSDQDDVWLPGKVETCTAALSSPDVWLVLHDAHIVDAEQNRLHESFFEWRGVREGTLRNLIKNSFIGCCMAFRRELLDIALPFPDGIPMHDQWLGMLAMKYGEVVFLKKPLLDYRRHGGNASADRHGSWGSMIRNRFRLWRALRERQRKVKKENRHGEI
ncbi:MAG: glycosyltransferase family 2 protein [Clostridia bacterium]|nr:glycosyltransferase family 2 protein [Clostridia bacterium]